MPSRVRQGMAQQQARVTAQGARGAKGRFVYAVSADAARHLVATCPEAIRRLTLAAAVGEASTKPSASASMRGVVMFFFITAVDDAGRRVLAVDNRCTD